MVDIFYDHGLGDPENHTLMPDVRTQYSREGFRVETSMGTKIYHWRAWLHGSARETLSYAEFEDEAVSQVDAIASMF